MIAQLLNGWRERRSLRRLCGVLIRDYGRPRYYTVGQIETAAQKVGLRSRPEIAFAALTKGADKELVAARSAFAEQYLGGRTKFSANDVVTYFCPMGPASIGAFWNNPSDCGGTMPGGDGGGDCGGGGE